MDKKKQITYYLKEWQTDIYEEIETATDIRVFNTVGTIIQLLDANMLELDKIYEFATDILSLTKEEKEAVYSVYLNAFLKYSMELSKEDEKDGDKESL